MIAGPGTGKTMTLTHRIARLIRDGIAAPDDILALTFTRKATLEMEQRISRLLEGFSPDKAHVSTFHAFCLEVLRSFGNRADLPPDFKLCSELDTESLAKQILGELGAGKQLIRKFIKAAPDIKIASVLGPPDEPFDPELVALFEKYRQKVRSLGMLDLDDLEVEAMRLLRENPEVAPAYTKKYPWIFVDEYQDTNPVQVELLKTIIRAGSTTLCAIGDPDQAIYGFRGADVANFHKFSEDFPDTTIVLLARNYRSTEFILKGAAALMEHTKALGCESGKGRPISIASCRTDAEEAEMIVEQVERLMGGTSHFSMDSGRVASHEGDLSLSLADIGVLYRLNSQGAVLEKALDRAGIPFIRSGEAPLISRYPVNILWRFFQTLQHPETTYYATMYRALTNNAGQANYVTDRHFTDIHPLPEFIDRAVSWHDFDLSTEETHEALGRLKNMANDFEGDMAAFLDTLSLERGLDHTSLMGDRLALMSLHSAKGLEWPVVFITGCEDKLIPCSLFGSRDDEEEKRLFYVGMTRAEKRLVLSHVDRRSLNGRVLDMKPSPFLHAVPENLRKPLDRAPWKAKQRPHKQLSLF